MRFAVPIYTVGLLLLVGSRCSAKW